MSEYQKCEEMLNILGRGIDNLNRNISAIKKLSETKIKIVKALK